jgi:hypothetical protein
MANVDIEVKRSRKTTQGNWLPPKTLWIVHRQHQDVRTIGAVLAELVDAHAEADIFVITVVLANRPSEV